MDGDCPKCGRMFFGPVHACPPQWDCWIEDDDPDGEYASDHPTYAGELEDAAERWIQREDFRGEHYLATHDGRSLIVCVRPHGQPDAEVHHYEVWGEMVPHYTTRALGPVRKPADGKPAKP